MNAWKEFSSVLFISKETYKTSKREEMAGLKISSKK
jgi:hypothetical protein